MNESRSHDGESIFYRIYFFIFNKKLYHLEDKSNVFEQQLEQFSIQKPLYPNLEYRWIFQILEKIMTSKCCHLIDFYFCPFFFEDEKNIRSKIKSPSCERETFIFGRKKDLSDSRKVG